MAITGISKVPGPKPENKVRREVSGIGYGDSGNFIHMSSNALTWDGLFGSLPVVTAVVVAILLQLGFTYIPFMQNLFGTVALNFTQWFFIISFGLGLFLIVEFEKFVTRYFFIGTKI